MDEKIKISSLASKSEEANRSFLTKLAKQAPIPENECLSNTGLFLKRQELSKVLFFNYLYEKILNLHGIIIEFGCRWGQNLVTLNNLRGIHEPYNYNRKIVGFDTFEGFRGVSEKDHAPDAASEGDFSVSPGYEEFLEKVLECHHKESPLSHIPKNTIIKGEASEELRKYLDRNPQTIISFAWFDFDIYEPTKKCLELIKPHLTKGSLIGFDQLNDPKFPGETAALKEFAEINSLRIQRNKFSGMQSYIEF